MYDEQVKLYGYSQTAIEKTIYICSKENVLKDYLEERKKEVHDIMFTLFDPDEVMERHIEYEKLTISLIMWRKFTGDTP
ncbi:MAG: hypothetical protein IKN43_07900 [Selenomonadaceae bacterium]|nr:hypothetical protein [Selenomonadaceae bacterium]